MKIRTCFVSNSSSSSFLILVKKALHEKLKKTLHPYVIAVMEAVGGEVKEKCFGNVVMAFCNNMDRSGEGSLEWISVDYEDDVPINEEGYNKGDKMSKWDAWEIYEEEVKKHPGEFFTNSEDF